MKESYGVKFEATNMCIYFITIRLFHMICRLIFKVYEKILPTDKILDKYSAKDVYYTLGMKQQTFQMSLILMFGSSLEG